jgi:hypothetical protein
LLKQLGEHGGDDYRVLLQQLRTKRMTNAGLFVIEEQETAEEHHLPETRHLKPANAPPIQLFLAVEFDPLTNVLVHSDNESTDPRKQHFRLHRKVSVQYPGSPLYFSHE